MKIRISVDVSLSENASPDAVAESVFDLLASDPDDAIPQIQTVDDYSWKRVGSQRDLLVQVGWITNQGVLWPINTPPHDERLVAVFVRQAHLAQGSPSEAGETT